MYLFASIQNFIDPAYYPYICLLISKFVLPQQQIIVHNCTSSKNFLCAYFLFLKCGALFGIYILFILAKFSKNFHILKIKGKLFGTLINIASANWLQLLQQVFELVLQNAYWNFDDTFHTKQKVWKNWHFVKA